MPDVPEHHSEQEWENLNGIQGGVDFLIARGAIGFHDQLERGSESVGFKISGGCGSVLFYLFERHKGRHQVEEQPLFFLGNPELPH